MAGDRPTQRFNQADLDRLEAKMRGQTPPAMHLRPTPGGTMRSMGDAYAREQQNELRGRMQQDVAVARDRPLDMNDTTRTSFSARDLGRFR